MEHIPATRTADNRLLWGRIGSKRMRIREDVPETISPVDDGETDEDFRMGTDLPGRQGLNVHGVQDRNRETLPSSAPYEEYDASESEGTRIHQRGSPNEDPMETHPGGGEVHDRSVPNTRQRQPMDLIWLQGLRREYGETVALPCKRHRDKKNELCII